VPHGVDQPFPPLKFAHKNLKSEIKFRAYLKIEGLIKHLVASSRCKENSAWPFKRAAFDYLNTLSLYTTFSLFKHTLTAHT